jgi:hypothetical protein
MIATLLRVSEPPARSRVVENRAIKVSNLTCKLHAFSGPLSNKNAICRTRKH